MEIYSCSRFVAPRRAFARLVLCLGFVFAGVMSLAAAEEAGKRSYDIPAGNAADALKQFSEQSGRGVMANGDLVKGIRTNAVKGEHAPVDALELLLADTGLVAIPDTKSGAFSIRKETVIEAKNVNRAIAESSKSGRPEQSVRTEKIGGEEVLKMPDYMVVGTKTLNADIARTKDDIQPYVIFNHEEIVRSGASNIEDYLKTRLPMNTAIANPDQTSNGAGNVVGLINLRGLGENQTLILVDGRRLVSASGANLGFQQPSLSGIPLASIERIEVLPTSAGAIYGGGATGGVINVILKRNYSGVELQTSFGNTFDTDVGSVELSLAGGFSFNDGHTQVSFSASHSNANSLRAADRDFALRARQMLMDRNPGLITAALPLQGATSNISRATIFSPTDGIFEPGNLTLDNGQTLYSPIASVPTGYAGPASDSGAGLAGRSGSYNLRTPTDGQYLLRTPRRDAFTADIRQDFGRRIEAFLTASGDRVVSDMSQPGFTSQIFTFAGSDPVNPFQEDIMVKLAVPNLRAPGQTTTKNLRLTGGLIVRLPKDWSATLEHNWNHASNSYQFTAQSLLTDAGITALRAVAFRDLNAYPFDFAPYLNAVPNQFGGPFTTTLDATTLRASGPLFQLPAGPVQLTTSLEHRKEKALEAFEENISSNPFVAGAVFYPARFQNVNSAYVETQIPLVGKEQQMSLVNGLELQASIRRDAYKTTNTDGLFQAATRAGPFPALVYRTNKLASTDYLGGIRYSPTPDIAIRASVSTGFLPPSLDQIVPTVRQQTIGFFAPLDPKRGNTRVRVPYTTISGGNPSLHPEKSRSTSAGLVLTPSFLSGLRLSVDYTRIHKTDEISFIGANILLANESVYPGRVVRGPNLPTDLPGWAGPVTQIDTSALNIFSSTVQAIDYQADYRWDAGNAGRFKLTAIATQARQFKRQLVVNQPEFDSVGYSGGPLTWKGNAGLTWERGAWTVGWNMQYFHSYHLTTTNPNSVSTNAATIARQGEFVSSQKYHDLFVSYRFGAGWKWLANTEVSLSVQNVLDSSPPIIVPRFGNDEVVATYSTYGDPRLRRFVLSVRKSFGK